MQRRHTIQEGSHCQTPTRNRSLQGDGERTQTKVRIVNRLHAAKGYRTVSEQRPGRRTVCVRVTSI